MQDTSSGERARSGRVSIMNAPVYDWPLVAWGNLRLPVDTPIPD